MLLFRSKSFCIKIIKQRFVLVVVKIILLTAPATTNAQAIIFLKNKAITGRCKILKPGRNYTIKTASNIYYSKLFNITDSSLDVTHLVETGKDTALLHARMRMHQDTTVFMNKYRTDTATVLFKNIVYIKADLIGKKGWLQPFGDIAMGAVLNVLLLPVTIFDKTTGIGDWASFEGTLLLIAVPPILISFIRKKYDVKNKWLIAIRR